MNPRRRAGPDRRPHPEDETAPGADVERAKEPPDLIEVRLFALV